MFFCGQSCAATGAARPTASVQAATIVSIGLFIPFFLPW
jgi:hypothetical protein